MVCSNVTKQEKQENPFTAMTAVLSEGQWSFKHAENLYHVLLQKYVFGDGKQQAMAMLLLSHSNSSKTICITTISLCKEHQVLKENFLLCRWGGS